MVIVTLCSLYLTTLYYCMCAGVNEISLVSHPLLFSQEPVFSSVYSRSSSTPQYVMFFNEVRISWMCECDECVCYCSKHLLLKKKNTCFCLLYSVSWMCSFACLVLLRSILFCPRKTFERHTFHTSLPIMACQKFDLSSTSKARNLTLLSSSHPLCLSLSRGVCLTKLKRFPQPIKPNHRWQGESR